MLEPFVEELQVLGGDLRRDFEIHGGIIRLWGVLLAVVADTLASNMLGNKRSLLVVPKESVIIAWQT